jgi:hypothetical protein
MIKTFDCVELKNELQKKIYEEIKPENLEEYCRKIKVRRKNNELFQYLKDKIVK